MMLARSARDNRLRLQKDERAAGLPPLAEQSSHAKSSTQLLAEKLKSCCSCFSSAPAPAAPPSAAGIQAPMASVPPLAEEGASMHLAAAAAQPAAAGHHGPLSPIAPLTQLEAAAASSPATVDSVILGQAGRRSRNV